MAEFKQQGQTQTSTQIRNLYSPDLSYLNIKFFNMKLSFRFVPFTGRDQNGRPQYDEKNGQQTTVDFEGAFALYVTARGIIDGKIKECDLNIPCPGGSMNLKRSMGQNGQPETIFTINKNGMAIPFKFNTIVQNVNEDGQMVLKQIETGLGAFMKTVEGYLTGINADRHLNKLTDDFVAIQNQQNGGQNSQQQQQGGQRPWNGQKKFNNNNNRRPYNNNGQYNNHQNNWPQNNQQNMSTYNLPN